MKKTILLTAIISAFFLAGCTTNNQTTFQDPNQVKENQPAKTITQDDSENSENNVFLIPEIGIKIVFPNEYAITKNNEDNRRGSFVSYNFNYKSPPPAFQEIQLFNEKSIKQFIEKCDANSPCFFDDYPNLERYNGQKNAFATSKNYEEYELKKFGNRNYFVSNFRCTGDSCVIREYTTFINDTKIDLWITMENDTQVTIADNLFKEFEIME